MKDLYCTIMRTFGIIASTSKESFMEGWNNPYIAEEDVEESDDVVKARHLDEELKNNASYL